MERFLAASEIIDWKSAPVLRLARQLAIESSVLGTVNRCFVWVRDEIRHSADHGLTTVTCLASDVLEHRTGFCYAKSHLLAALLRANGIPTGFCYQRLLLDAAVPRFCLHGLNAVHLPGFGWYRIDARGNTGAIQTQFCPPAERLAYAPTHPGECDVPGIYAEPLGGVITVLTRNTQVLLVSENLPDWDPSDAGNGMPAA